MIKLEVAEYCHECPKFEQECTKFYYGDGNCITSISCQNRGMCANIKLYIEKHVESDNHCACKTLKDVPISPILGPTYKGGE